VLTASWIVAFFGLGRGRLSPAVLLLAVLGAGAWIGASARRRRIALARERWLRAGAAAAHPSNSVRRISS
jgi:hypothetical protein